MLSRALQVSIGNTYSFVGAGGKTSLMFALADELAKMNYDVLVTTTTAMFHPKYINFRYDKIIFGNMTLCDHLPFGGNSIVVGAYSYDKKNKKVIGYSPEYITKLGESKIFDFILVEADGAKMKSIKAPAAHEPVIPEITSTIVGCIGLDCIGKQINNDIVHRSDFFLALSAANNSCMINEEKVMSLISSKKGLFKDVSKKISKIVFLNKADDTYLIEKGRRIAFSVKNNCPQIKCTIVASLEATINPIKIII